MTLKFREATRADAPALLALRLATAERLTHDFGAGPWSHQSTEAGVLFTLRNFQIIVACSGKKILAMLALSSKKPWAIDTSYFQKSKKPLYLTHMAVDPERQRCGVGHALLKEAQRIARAQSADAIRLDAFDAPAGAGGFYAKCGFQEVGRAVYRGAPLVYYELLL
jgi:ribosomal protein S18 acetylase RimI-like enzyme